MNSLANELRHRITVQAMGPNRDEDNYPIEPIWTEYKKLWAKVTHLSGKDLIAAQANQSKCALSTKIKCMALIVRHWRIPIQAMSMSPFYYRKVLSIFR